jgi:PAS domain S-box-containing protein
MISPIRVHFSTLARPFWWSVQRLASSSLVFAVVGATFISGLDTLAAVSPRQPRVLILYSNDRLLPANVIADEAMRATFAAGTNATVDFYSEFLDVDRFPGEAEQERTREFLRDKYRERPPDLIIAGGGPALAFLLKFRATMFTPVPMVHCGVSPNALPKTLPDDRIVGIAVLPSAAATLDLALRLQPDTRQIAVVGGGNPVAPWQSGEFAPFAQRVDFLWLTNQTLPELRAELSRLPDHTVVLYRALFRDADGNTFTPRAALEQIAPASRVPIYGYYDTYLGHGIVGGSMVTFETIGRVAAQIGLRILAGEQPQVAVRAQAHEPTPMFDWHQLQRWNISEGRLPPGSVVRFRPPTLWGGHKDYVIGGLCVIVAQTLTITLLLVQGRRRRQAQRALLESEERMKLAADAAQLGLWVGEVSTQRLWTSDQCNRLFGYPPNIELGLAELSARVHPEDRAIREWAIEQALAGTGNYDPEYRVLLPDGSVRWLASAGRVERDASGKPTRLLGVVVDITERHNAETFARDLGGRLINAQEAERSRIARDLHDDLSQRLALLSVELEMFGQKPPPQREAIAGRMEEFSGAVKRLSSDVHRLAHELHPAKLDQLGLVAGVRGFCKELAGAHDLAITFEPREVPRMLPNDVALCLYRITQEALQNVVKHSGANGATVALAADERELHLSVTDDGRGFDPQAMPTNGSLGIVSMRERVRMVQGQISVQSRPGEGTRIEVRVPIPAPA